MTFLRYLRKLLEHKWYVFVAGLRVGVPWWRLIIHDWSKFLPSEFIPYARHDFASDEPDPDFDRAWLLHQNRQPHHWQFWYLIQDSDPEKALPMPEVYVREMVADWMGASKAYTDSWNMASWISNSGPRIERWMHEDTIDMVHEVLYELGYALTDNAPWICILGKGVTP